MERMRVRLTLIDDMLGTASGDPDIHGTFIASNAPDAPSMAEEIEAVGIDGVKEKGKTIFSRDNEGNPILWNYQIKGFFKSACQALRAIDGTHSKQLKAYKKQIDLRIFVFADADNKASRMIPIKYDGVIDSCQRPLRAQTLQGERVAIADSEVIHAGATIEFDIEMFDKHDKRMVKEWLDYGQYNGLGQWRNSGKGAFTWEELETPKAKDERPTPILCL